MHSSRLLTALLLIGCDRSPASSDAFAPSSPVHAPPPTVPAAATLGVGAAVGATNIELSLGAPSGQIAFYTGINMGPSAAGTGTRNLSEVYHERGLTLVRTHGFEGAFDLVDTTGPDAFARTDAEARVVAAGGLGLFLRLGDSWHNSADGDDPKADLDGMVKLVRHLKTSTPPGFIPYVEIWNEPDTKQFWRGSAADFADLYIKAAKAIRAIDPSVRIGGPGFSRAAVVFPRSEAFVKEFLAAVRQAGAPLDFFSWHMYANDPADFAGAAATYRADLQSAGFGDLEQVVTEWNTAYQGVGSGGAGGGGGPGAHPVGGASGGRPAGGPPGSAGRPPGGPQGGQGPGSGGGRPAGGADTERSTAASGAADQTQDPNVRVGAEASAWTTGAWIAMQQAGVDQAFFHRGPDPKPYPSAFFGMFYSDGTAKPAGVAALLWKRMMDHPTARALTGPTTGPLWALAGQDASGETAILLANAGDKALSWSVAGATPTQGVRLSRLRSPATTIEEATLPTLSGTLDPHEAALVTFR